MSETPTVRLGQVVPDFKFDYYDPTKGDFGSTSLNELMKANKWTVLVFYPADFTFVCATEFQALADLQDRFAKLGAEIVTVSTDTKYTHLAWQREEKELANVRYKMAADANHQLSRMFGVLDEGAGIALRGTFVISPQGKLMNSEVNFFNLGRNMDELLRKVKANIHLAKHGDEACPAKWKDDGDKTLKPTAKMVGRVHDALKA